MVFELCAPHFRIRAVNVVKRSAVDTRSKHETLPGGELEGLNGIDPNRQRLLILLTFLTLATQLTLLNVLKCLNNVSSILNKLKLFKLLSGLIIWTNLRLCAYFYPKQLSTSDQHFDMNIR